jgi:hypothetical protein
MLEEMLLEEVEELLVVMSLTTLLMTYYDKIRMTLTLYRRLVVVVVNLVLKSLRLVVVRVQRVVVQSIILPNVIVVFKSCRRHHRCLQYRHRHCSRRLVSLLRGRRRHRL